LWARLQLCDSADGRGSRCSSSSNAWQLRSWSGKERRLYAPLILLSGCSLLTDLDGLTGHGSSDAGPSAAGDPPPPPDLVVDASEAGSDAEAGDSGPRCRGTKGPKSVIVGGYCIDATEVTSGDYTEFLAAKAGDTSGQPADCSWNTSYDPDFGSPPNMPVMAVDWCDAFMYCQWAGKRLCGRIGGGTTPPAVLTNPDADEWYQVCTKGGTRQYPYGDTYVSGRCNTGGVQNGVVDVGSFPDCEGGYPGVFDMAGNAWEWTDNCSGAGEAATCWLRGQAYETDHDGQCSLMYEQRRDRGGQTDMSFRCCSDLD
jgi:formylglycine-generating enzyme required for sulfatase activity